MPSATPPCAHPVELTDVKAGTPVERGQQVGAGLDLWARRPPCWMSGPVEITHSMRRGWTRGADPGDIPF
jgi:hypothetical protein